MTVLELYKKYRIHAGLQMHQLRVAAVASMVCDASSAPVDSQTVINACLFHDMGNIIKSNLALFPELMEPEGVEYWQKVKDEFVAKYGIDEHAATLAIAKDMGLSGSVFALMAGIGFSHSKEILATGSRELQIAEYADMRVGPHGILSMQERLEEGRKRYQKQHSVQGVFNADYEGNAAALGDMEHLIFESASTRPEDITDASAHPVLQALRTRAI